jgi:serine/threonine-protein kinase
VIIIVSALHVRQHQLQLYLLGGIELRGVDATSADRLLAQSKLAALLALLALSPEGRMQRRDRLVGLLWPELDQTHARGALRKAIHAVRATVGHDAVRSRGDEEIGLDASVFWCDASDLAASADQGLLGRAVELYRGELMPGFHLTECAEFERWLEDERSAARERAAAAAWALARTLEAEKHLTDAGMWARRAARYSWDDERVLRRTMSMLARIGDHAGALSLYDEFAMRMRKELDAAPSPETVALVESLRA